jgi:hypothetical protein
VARFGTLGAGTKTGSGKNFYAEESPPGEQTGQSLKAQRQIEEKYNRNSVEAAREKPTAKMQTWRETRVPKEDENQMEPTRKTVTRQSKPKSAKATFCIELNHDLYNHEGHRPLSLI